MSLFGCMSSLIFHFSVAMVSFGKGDTRQQMRLYPQHQLMSKAWNMLKYPLVEEGFQVCGHVCGMSQIT